jgi:hypothetical protein
VKIPEYFGIFINVVVWKGKKAYRKEYRKLKQEKC